MNVVVIFGSVRKVRNGTRVSQFVARELEPKGWNVSVVDPAEWDLPMLDKRYFEMKEPEEKYEKLHKMFDDADGFIVVTAEYNRLPPPALLNILNYYGKEFRQKACGIVSYSTGGFGGVRAGEVLRLFVSELGMPAVPASFPVSHVAKTLSEDGVADDGAMSERFAKFVDQFEWYMEALKNQRERKSV